MLRRIVIVALLAISVGGCRAMHERHNAAMRRAKWDTSSAELTERRELHQTYELASGAKVTIQGISGSVEIETGTGPNAEVNIVESAASQDDLNNRHIDIQQTAEKLELRGESDRRRGGFWSLFGRSGTVRQQLKLKLPAEVDLTLRGISGPVTASAIKFPIRINGVDGNVTVTGAAQSVGISGVNGNLAVNMSKVGEKGVAINAVNGNVDLGVDSKLNALFRVSAVNGKIQQDIPNLNVLGEQRRGNLDAQAGTGGTLIRISGVNGNVHLLTQAHQAAT